MGRINYPVIGGLYKHYKGGTYKVITLGNHTETNEVLVVYSSIEFGCVYIRPLSEWFEEINTDTNSLLFRFSITN